MNLGNLDRTRTLLTRTRPADHANQRRPRTSFGLKPAPFRKLL